PLAPPVTGPRPLITRPSSFVATRTTSGALRVGTIGGGTGIRHITTGRNWGVGSATQTGTVQMYAILEYPDGPAICVGYRTLAVDPGATRERLDSFESVVAMGGRTRARFLVTKLLERARAQQVGLPSLVSTDYINTIAPDREPWFPGDEEMELRIRRINRWNA